MVLDEGDGCVCVQSISHSLLCRWFRAAVLPLDHQLETALYHRLESRRCSECGALFLPGSNRAKYCREYIEPADGLIHCKKCHGSRQTVVPRFGDSGYFMPRCLCPCQQKAQEERKAMEEQRERMERIKRRKAQGLQDRYLRQSYP